MIEDTGATDAAADPVVEELLDLSRRAEEEGVAVLPEIRAFLDLHPDLSHRIGDLAENAKLAVIDTAVGGHALGKEAAMRRATELEAELAGPDASPLEKLLAGHVTVAWLAAAEAEATAAANGKAAPLPRADFLDRRRDRAHKRLESALKTLAIVRKLLRPAPSPVEVATRLGGVAARAAARQNAPTPHAVGVDN